MGDGTFLTFVSSKGTSSFGIGLRKDWALAIFWGDLGWSNTLDFTSFEEGFCKQPLSTSDTLPFVLKRMKKFGKNPKLKHDRIKKYKKEKKTENNIERMLKKMKIENQGENLHALCFISNDF